MIKFVVLSRYYHYYSIEDVLIDWATKRAITNEYQSPNNIYIHVTPGLTSSQHVIKEETILLSSEFNSYENKDDNIGREISNISSRPLSILSMLSDINKAKM